MKPALLVPSRIVLSLALFVGLAALSRGADDVATAAGAVPKSLEAVLNKIDIQLEPVNVTRGQTVLFKINASIIPGWHTYPLVQPDPEWKVNVTPITIEAGHLVPVGDYTAPKSKLEPEGFEVVEGDITWSRQLVVKPDAAPGSYKLDVKVKLQICDDKKCLQPKTIPLSIGYTITDAAPVSVDPKYANDLKSPTQPEAAPKEEDKAATLLISAKTSADYREQMVTEVADKMEPTNSSTAQTGLVAFMLAGVFWGAISLITPCVFPMIPITVSYFLKQSEKEHHKPMTMALVYCATIVVVLTIAAVTLLSFFRWLSVNPYMNYALGALFVFFALSLFGAYEIELPSGLARYTSQHEGKGGLVGTMFMALTFTIISFACVAPFLGGFGGTAANSNMTWAHRILGGFAFSITFASPFFILALFPALLKKMPKSGNWLNNVKVVMGFLELAAALKFFRAAEIVLSSEAEFFTYDFVLGLWIALSILCGLYLLGVYRLPLDTPVEHLSVGRLVFAIGFLGLGFYLVPAMFKITANGESQRPNGVVYAWVDSFLLPDSHASAGGDELAWTGNLPEAIAKAREYQQKTGERKLVFVDFTGVNCTNCRINERDVFSKNEFKELFKPYQLVQLYTDKVPDYFYAPDVRSTFKGSVTRQKEDAQQVNLWFQRKMFNDEKLPLYAILEPTLDGKIKVVGVYQESRINNQGEFAEFLRKPQEEDAAQASAR